MKVPILCLVVIIFSASLVQYQRRLSQCEWVEQDDCAKASLKKQLFGGLSTGNDISLQDTVLKILGYGENTASRETNLLPVSANSKATPPVFPRYPDDQAPCFFRKWILLISFLTLNLLNHCSKILTILEVSILLSIIVSSLCSRIPFHPLFPFLFKSLTFCFSFSYCQWNSKVPPSEVLLFSPKVLFPSLSSPSRMIYTLCFYFLSFPFSINLLQNILWSPYKFRLLYEITQLQPTISLL